MGDQRSLPWGWPMLLARSAPLPARRGGGGCQGSRSRSSSCSVFLRSSHPEASSCVIAKPSVPQGRAKLGREKSQPRLHTKDQQFSVAKTSSAPELQERHHMLPRAFFSLHRPEARVMAAALFLWQSFQHPETALPWMWKPVCREGRAMGHTRPLHEPPQVASSLVGQP